MGSSCLIKTCTVKKSKVGASFHRLPWKYPSLFQTLQHVFGSSNVRELTRWSRICSLHIAQLAPLATTDEVVRRLMEYYSWNARSYKRIFELSKCNESIDTKGSANETVKIQEGIGALGSINWTLEDFVKSGLFVLGNKDKSNKNEAACGDCQSVSSSKSEASLHFEEDEETGLRGVAASGKHGPGVESGHCVGQYLLQILAGALATAAPPGKGLTTMDKIVRHPPGFFF